jgi:hypothetical protein
MGELKIISNGTLMDTHIFDQDTGAEIKGVTKIKWEIDAKSLLAKAYMEVEFVKIEAIVKTKIKRRHLSAVENRKKT